jgi:hypothetical protein
MTQSDPGNSHCNHHRHHDRERIFSDARKPYARKSFAIKKVFVIMALGGDGICDLVSQKNAQAP